MQVNYTIVMRRTSQTRDIIASLLPVYIHLVPSINGNSIPHPFACQNVNQARRLTWLGLHLLVGALEGRGKGSAASEDGLVILSKQKRGEGRACKGSVCRFKRGRLIYEERQRDKAE